MAEVEMHTDDDTSFVKKAKAKGDPSIEANVLALGRNGIDGQGMVMPDSLSPTALTALFGGMWAMTGRAPDPNLSEVEYKQCLNRNEYYTNMRHELLSVIMTAAMHNSQNLWLLNSAMPIFESSVKTYTKHEKEWNALPYTPKIEGGHDNQPTYSESRSEQTSGIEVSQSVSFSVNLARDPNFGAQVWFENLNELQKNLALTMMRSSIVDLRDIAYKNSTHNKRNEFVPERLYANEVNMPFISVQNPRAFYDLITDYMAEYEGLNLCILPPRASRFLAELPEPGKPEQMPAMTLYYDANAMQLKPKMKPGAQSSKTFRTPHGKVHFKEMVNFKVNRFDKNPFAPITSTVLFGEFFECNPRISPNDRITAANSEALDIWITLQTQQRVEKRKLAFRDCLRHCFYWDRETGQISKEVEKYINELNAKKDVPAQWAKSGSRDINEDKGDFNAPDYAARSHIGPLSTLDLFRGQSCVSVFDPRTQTHRKALHIGAMNLAILPNKWIMPVVNALSFVFFQETGIHPSSIVARLGALRDKIMKAPISAVAIRKLIDAQMLALNNNGGAITKNGIPEFVPDSNGSLRLPENDDASLTGMKYFNGFQSGAGLLTARDWQLQAGGAFAEMSQEASEVLYPVERWIDFIAEHVGATEIIDPDMAKEWFIVDREAVRQSGGRDPRVMATFIDSVYPPGVPVFLGKPKQSPDENNTSKYSYGVTEDTPTQRKESLLGRIVRDITTGHVALPSKDELENRLATFEIDLATQAFACLSYDVAMRLSRCFVVGIAKGELSQIASALVDGEKIFDDNEVQQAYHRACVKLFELIVATCGYPTRFQAKNQNKEEQKTNRNLATWMAAHFFNTLCLKAFPNLLDSTNKTKTGKKAQLEACEKALKLVADLSDARNIPTQAKEMSESDAFKSTVPSMAENLVAAVNELNKRTIGKVDALQDAQQKENFRAEAAKDKAVRYFKGVYTGEPGEYLRSPLMSSPKLIDFIKESGFLWALPGSEATNFTTPDYNVSKRFNPQVAVKGEAMKSFLTGFDARVSAISRGLGVQVPQRGLQQAKTSGYAQPSADRLFSFGAFGRGDDDAEDMEADDRAATRRRDWERESTVSQKQTPAELASRVMGDHYYGPWRARMEYAATIKDHWERVMFKAVCLAPNTLSVHENFCDMGVSVINLMPMRMSMRFKASSAILMQMGAASKRMSPVDVDISKNRDTFEVQVGFEHGTVVIEESKIHMLNAVFPEAYEGGKNMEFVTDTKQYGADDPNKPSIIVMPYSIATRDFAETVHVLNKATTRKLEKNEKCNPMAKVEFAGFFQSVFGHDTTNMMETLQMERSSFGRRGRVTHVLHKGTRTIYDPNTKETMEIEGYGSVNSSVMNRPGVEMVFQQIDNYLPAAK